jgi:hypothetical protein
MNTPGNGMKSAVKSECTECGGVMTAGVVVDFRRNVPTVEGWIPHRVVRTGIVGEPKSAERFVMSAYRCEDCGFLKMYACKPAPGWLA